MWDSVVDDAETKSARDDGCRHGEAHGVRTSGDPMLDRILDERLEDHGRDGEIHEFWRDLLDEQQPAREAIALDLEIALYSLKFFAKRNEFTRFGLRASAEVPPRSTA